MTKYHSEHNCLVIYFQGKWKEKYKDELLSNVKDLVFSSSHDANCHTCNTCPICRALNDIFDPKNPGEIDMTCGDCFSIYDVLKDKLGQGEGVILMSHFNPIPNELIEILMDNERIKKVYRLDLEIKDHYREHDIPKYIKKTKVTKSDFLKLNEIKNGMIYEIIKDEYF